MITRSEQEVLENICKSSRAALFDIHNIISKVYDEELALDLNLQAARYSGLEEKAANGLLEKGVLPEAINLKEKTKRWADIQKRTIFNVSTAHIADLIIQSKQERIARIDSTVNENPVIHPMIEELAEEFLDFESESMRILKDYLGI